MDDWGVRLQQALRQRRIRKLHALAVEIGVDQSAISRWRKGLPISLANAVSLCRALDISIDWLLIGRGTMDAHRFSTPATVETAADLLFAHLSAREAMQFRHTLDLLAEAAARRAAVPRR